jgi:hypothetical protein
MEITKNEIIKFITEKKLYLKGVSRSDAAKAFIEHIQREGTFLTEHGVKKVQTRVETLHKVFRDEYEKLYRCAARVEKNLASDEVFISIRPSWIVKPETSAQVGRRSKEFADLAKSSLYAKGKQIAEKNQNCPKLLLHAVLAAATLKEEKKLAKLISAIISKYDDLDDYAFVDKRTADSMIEVMTPIESLQWMFQFDLSRDAFQGTKNKMKEHNADILASYKKVQEVKKECRPDESELEFTDTKASTTIKGLAEHTIQRTLEAEKDNLKEHIAKKGAAMLEGEMHFSYGGDGTSGLTPFNQRTSDKKESIIDKSLFTMSATPVFLRLGDEIVWINEWSQSAMRNRPILLEYAKETDEYTTEMFDDIKKQIEELEPVRANVDGTPVVIKCIFHPTSIDGKVLNNRTRTSSQQCPMCRCLPKSFNDMKNFAKGSKTSFEVKDKNCLDYGLCSLHSILKAFDLLLKISTKRDLQKWQARGKKDKDAVKERKAEILERLEEAFHVKFEAPRAGGFGNSTTGGLVRKAFADPVKLADALELDRQLVKNLSIIVYVINSRERVNFDAYEKLCMNTYKYFDEETKGEYSWYKLSASMHKILAHSTEIMKKLPLPAGYFSEEGAESHNKLYKKHRLNHARKIGLKENLEDVFKRSLEMSDPVVSSLGQASRDRKRKHRPIPESVKPYLLQSQDPMDVDEQSDNDEDETELNLSIDNETYEVTDDSDDE